MRDMQPDYRKHLQPGFQLHSPCHHLVQECGLHYMLAVICEWSKLQTMPSASLNCKQQQMRRMALVGAALTRGLPPGCMP